jgi:hypothetical protein
MNSYKHKDILALLRKLPAEDKVFLGLYIYEKLSDQQVDNILSKRDKQTKLPIMERESI